MVSEWQRDMLQNSDRAAKAAERAQRDAQKNARREFDLRERELAAQQQAAEQQAQLQREHNQRLLDEQRRAREEQQNFNYKVWLDTDSGRSYTVWATRASAFLDEMGSQDAAFDAAYAVDRGAYVDELKASGNRVAQQLAASDPGPVSKTLDRWNNAFSIAAIAIPVLLIIATSVLPGRQLGFWWTALAVVVSAFVCLWVAGTFGKRHDAAVASHDALTIARHAGANP
ncbi:hypothetical protein ACEK07_40680, partial [Alcanivoracaceae bacterium MT1]